MKVKLFQTVRDAICYRILYPEDLPNFDNETDRLTDAKFIYACMQFLQFKTGEYFGKEDVIEMLIVMGEIILKNMTYDINGIDFPIETAIEEFESYMNENKVSWGHEYVRFYKRMMYI